MGKGQFPPAAQGPRLSPSPARGLLSFRVTSNSSRGGKLSNWNPFSRTGPLILTYFTSIIYTWNRRGASGIWCSPTVSCLLFYLAGVGEVAAGTGPTATTSEVLRPLPASAPPAAARVRTAPPPHLRGLLPRRAAQPSLHFRPGSNLSPGLAPGNGGSLLPP